MAGRIAYYGGIVTNSLVLNLDAAKRDSYPGSGTTWKDISGNGNNGTLVNGPTFNSGNGGSIVFDGIDDTTNFSSLTSYSGITPHTYTSWIKSPRFDQYDWILNNGSLNTGTSLITFNGKIGFFYKGGDAVVQGNSQLNVNTWYYISSVYLGETTVLLYVNGILDATKNTNSPTAGIGGIGTNWNSGNSNPRLGLWYNGNFPFQGNIANVQIYNRALSATEILQNYNATKGRYGL